MSQKQKFKPFRGDIWFEKQVHQRTVKALSENEERFAQEHRDDTDEQLLAYVRETAAAYGYAPHAAEITGGEYIASRFGGWGRVLMAARLRAAGKLPSITKRRNYKEEFARQAKLFKKERQEIKETRRRSYKEKCRERDVEWGKDHEHDTDEQLVDYVRQCAAELGHTPAVREIVGGYYIRSRFGTWAVVIYLAKLPLEHGINPPNQDALDVYQKMRAERAAAAK